MLRLLPLHWSWNDDEDDYKDDEDDDYDDDNDHCYSVALLFDFTHFSRIVY